MRKEPITTTNVLKALSLGTICYAFNAGNRKGSAMLYQMTVEEWNWYAADVTTIILKLAVSGWVETGDDGRIHMTAQGRAWYQDGSHE